MDASIVASNEQVSSKNFFFFLHKGWWTIIILAILLRLLVPDSFIVSSFLINVAATFLLIKVATLIHECGHLLAARISGGTPRRMELGIGHEIFRTRIHGIRIVVNSMPFGGRAWADFSETYTKWKFAFYGAGGVILNLLVASVFYLVFGFDLMYFDGKGGVDIPSAIITTN